MKKVIWYAVLLIGIPFIKSCSPHYVSAQPKAVFVQRSAQPSSSHIWIEGNWNWNRKNRAYNLTNGYWTVPNRNRHYRPGRWHSNQRGHYWKSGRWK